MHSVRKPTWQQATALVSLSTCGAMTGFSFAHGSVADMTSPTSMPVRLMAVNAPASPASSGDGALRSAIVTVARHYLQLAQSRTPAEMEALIWQADSLDGADHGQSCAAFASLTLALGAQAIGQQSWATGGGSYPWPLHGWADVRVETNPASPSVVSMQQDAQAHGRWHPLGDGYQPQPGDWVLFDGHVEVVTRYTGTTLYTVGADSLPNLTVNAHKFPAPLAAQGVLGFVDNGSLVTTAAQGTQPGGTGSAGGSRAPGGTAQVPGAVAQVATETAQVVGGGSGHGSGPAGSAAIPGAQVLADAPPGGGTATQAPGYRRHNPPPAAVPGTAAQQAFISEVAPGAIAAQQRYGIPAAVTIAQAIDESGWGQSQLATAGHNLFGIKGTGPAGSDLLPTQEYENGIWVTRTAPFRVYHDIAESIADHGRLLATDPAYQHAMADRRVPDAFAADLTGVYATDPSYGSNLIALMRLYNLYRYDAGAAASSQAGVPQGGQTGGQPADVPQGGQPAGGQLAAVPGLSATATSAAGAAAASAPGGRAPGGRVLGGRVLGGRAPGTAASGAAVPGASIPGSQVVSMGPPTARVAVPARSGGPGGLAAVPGLSAAVAAGSVRRRAARPRPRPEARITPRGAGSGTRRYVSQIPRPVKEEFVETAKAPLTRAQPLYEDVAGRTGIPWQLLAACDWMQCQAQPRFSPVHGEKLGTPNRDGTVYRTKSAALAQCARELIELAEAVYLVDLAAPRPLSVRELANAFAAFRWGGLLELHGISAMEFPYSVAGLTAQHLKMRWPDIGDPRAPDKPGTRFRMPFGAVPVVLSLGYRAVAS
jgi:hypothetical protein